MLPALLISSLKINACIYMLYYRHFTGRDFGRSSEQYHFSQTPKSAAVDNIPNFR